MDERGDGFAAARLLIGRYSDPNGIQPSLPRKLHERFRKILCSFITQCLAQCHSTRAKNDALNSHKTHGPSAMKKEADMWCLADIICRHSK